MTFNNILQYNQAFLNSIDSGQLEKLVENCFTSKTKNYELLAILTAKLGDYQLPPLQHAISILEDKAVEIMLNNYRNRNIQILEESPYAGLPSVWNQIKAPIPYGMSIKTKKEKILNMADKFLALKEDITKSDIENYALVAPLPQVFKLIIEKKVNLQEMDLSFPQFEVEYQKPLLTTNNYDSIEDILLTHTYAENNNVTEIRDIYTKLLNNNSKMANEALKFTALNILKGDDIKVFFSSEFGDFEGGYMPFLNYVIVNPISGKFTNSAIAIHEIGHYFFCNLSPDSGCFPFDNSKIKLLSSTPDNQYGFFLNHTDANNSSQISYFKELNQGNDAMLHYELAAKSVFTKTGELLGLEKNALDPYIFSKDSILHLKDNTLIDLFIQPEKLTLSQMKAFSEAYYQYSKEFLGTSLNKDSTFFENEETNAICFSKPSYEDIENLRFDDQKSLPNQIEFVKDYYLPYFINKMDLTDNQVWFLQRMSELSNREADIYDTPPSCSKQPQPQYNQYYIELIVRYPEFIDSGMDQDIIDSFSDLAKYYELTASPLAQDQITEFFDQYKAVDYSIFA